MKKTLGLFLIAALLLGGIAFGIFKIFSGDAGTPSAAKPAGTIVAPAPATPQEDEPIDYRNARYEVEGTEVPLVDGAHEVEAAPGSSAKVVTRVFGNEVFGDLNGDGREDVAFLITRNSGGSGTFFYVVVALRGDAGVAGTNAVLLGDRIAPQNSEIEDGVLVINYADRKPGEGFDVEPSVGVSKFFRVSENRLVETIRIAQFANREWKWISTQLNDGTILTPEQTDAFTITFREDGTLTGTTDCNNFFGPYRWEDGRLSLDQLASTKMACEGSQEGEFLKYLVEADGLMLDPQENTLVLLLKFDSGTMIFK